MDVLLHIQTTYTWAQPTPRVVIFMDCHQKQLKIIKFICNFVLYKVIYPNIKKYHWYLYFNEFTFVRTNL